MNFYNTDCADNNLRFSLSADAKDKPRRRGILLFRRKAFSMATLIVFGFCVMLFPFLKLAARRDLPNQSTLASEDRAQGAALVQNGSHGVKMKLRPTIPMKAVFATPQNFGNAKGAVLVDASNGKVLYAKEAEKKLPMASTTKIMTALVAAEMLSPDTPVKISPDAAGIEGSSIYLEAGETVSAKTLLCGLLLESGNDAASAIAIACAGSIEAFAQKMNQKATELGLESTHFTNPHGLHDDDHYTTARELALIACAALKNPEIAQIVASKSITCGGANSKVEGERVRCFNNHNKLLNLYDGACGIKTGFTKAAGRCLVSGARRNGMTLVAVTLGCPDDWNVHANMLNFGFENFRSVPLTPENGIDLSPFGINVSVGKDTLFETLVKNENPVFSYCITYSGGVARLEVKRHKS